MRKFLLENTHIERIVSFGDDNVFDEVSRHTLVLVFKKIDTNFDLKSAQVKIDNSLDLLKTTSVSFVDACSNEVPQFVFYQCPDHQLRFEGDNRRFSILKRIDDISNRLGDICYVNYGAQISSKEKGR